MTPFSDGFWLLTIPCSQIFVQDCWQGKQIGPIENLFRPPQAYFQSDLRYFIRTRLTGDAMKIITCFKLAVPEEQDITVISSIHIFAHPF